MSTNSFKIRSSLQLGNLSADPASGQNGEMYYNTSSNVFRTFQNGAWTTLSNAFPNTGVQSKTTTYSILNTDSLILCNATGGAFSVTLPSASGNTGLIIRIQKTDGSLNAVTETVTSKTLNTSAETRTFQSDGTNWQLIDWNLSTNWNSVSPTITAATGTVTGATANALYYRLGNWVTINANITFSGATGTFSKIGLNFPFTIDTTAFPATPTADFTALGDGAAVGAVGNPALKAIYATSSGVFLKRVGVSGGLTDVTFNFGSTDITTSTIININIVVPVTGWTR